VYINYDGYATYSMTFKPKAKVGLMTAGWTSCFHDGIERDNEAEGRHLVRRYWILL
jgi:hypothetical protein